jgi:two-component system chemotaxis sensor kinase CheA
VKKLSGQYFNEPMVEMYIFETTQLIEKLEGIILASEKASNYTSDTIDEIFRIMHTIKGSSAMMLFNNLSDLSHSVEDIFFFIREEKPIQISYETLADLMLDSVDFIKVELEKIKNGDDVDGDASILIKSINHFLIGLKTDNGYENKGDFKKKTNGEAKYYISKTKNQVDIDQNAYKATIFFEEGCEMENIRAYSVTHNLKDLTEDFFYIPKDIIDNDDTIQIIRNQGFVIYLKTEKKYEELHEFLMKTVFLRELQLIQLENDDEFKEQLEEQQMMVENNLVKVPCVPQKETKDQEIKGNHCIAHQNMISVNVGKLDQLMDLVGEMVIAEAMVTQNPELKDLELYSFHKAARQLHKITSELQDMVMSIRMVPLTTTFHKMHRIIRDMCKKLGKEVQLEIIGEETEVDKNIIEHISDPLMHLVRNAIDHGIEDSEERWKKGKENYGTITLEAKNAGSDVLIIVKDDGKGLDREKIISRAKEKGILFKPEEEMSDKEIYSLIFKPGFSTNEHITEFSGRGVGMDVVMKNIHTVGGSISVESMANKGTVVTIKIPLTLAIIDGMNIRVGKSFYTLPTIAIKESFRPRETDIIQDLNGNEMIMVRGECYPIIRLHERYKVDTDITEFGKGILVMVEDEETTFCIFADELLGEQQVVVKSLPNYIKRIKKIKGLAGCTLLGDGSISLILDVGGFRR